jgi:hypothetical protein
VVPVPAGGQDTQLEQIRKMQAKLDEEAGQLLQLRQNIGQEWAGRALAGEACHQAQDVQRRITDDARARLPPASSGVGQNLAVAAILLRAMPEPSTTEGRRIQGELKNLLEDVAVRRAESSASRRQRYPPGHRAVTSRFMREASVHTGRTRDTTPAAPGRLGNEHHHRDRRAHLDEKVRRGYLPGVGDATTVGRIGAPRPNRLVSKPSAGPYDGRRSRPGSEPRLPSPSTRGKQGWNCGLRTTGCSSSSATSPCSSPTPPEPGWSICLLRKSPIGTTWSRPLLETSRAHTCALGTLRISEAAASNQGNPCETTSGGF